MFLLWRRVVIITLGKKYHRKVVCLGIPKWGKKSIGKDSTPKFPKMRLYRQLA